MQRPKRNVPDEHRRALRLLADAPDGHIEAIMRAHGFDTALLADLVKAELVTARRERVRRGRRIVEVVRLRITEIGQGAFQQQTPGGLVTEEPRERAANDRLRRAVGSARIALLNRSDVSVFEALAVAAILVIAPVVGSDPANYATKDLPGTWIALFQQDRLTLGQASALAGLGQLAFQALMAERRIPIHYGVAEFREDIQTLRQSDGV